MTSSKYYQVSNGMVLNAINDMVELQNGMLTFSDTPNGKICFRIKMYSNEWEMCFSVEDDINGGCEVTLEIGAESKSDADILRREFSLLDSLLIV